MMSETAQNTQPIPLKQANIKSFVQGVKTPNYNRSALTPGIVHIGLGNFHRAHQSWYLHRLMEKGLAKDWAIIGAGVRPNDEIMRQNLKAQDYLTTLIELDPKGQSAEIVGSMIGFVPVERSNGPLIAQMADPAIRIVSLTVTEGGYYIDPVSKGLDTSHPDIRRDAENPDQPETAFGAMIAALKIRRSQGFGPFTAQSCDNLQGNGQILRQTLVSLARLSDPDLADWIDEECSFPNAMVDCIVPATGSVEMDMVHNYGIEDAAPVTHENFRQWVIEDDFCAGRPDWDLAGATFTDDVHGFETMKIRLLNGGHQIIAGAAEILGLHTVHQTMAHPQIAALLHQVCLNEIAPHVAPVPGYTPATYVDLIEERFSNPEIADTVRRIGFDGSSRHSGFIVPTIRDGLKKGTSIEGLALVEAVWARMCDGTREDGSQITPNDPHWAMLTAQAKKAKQTPRTWLEMTEIYGELADARRFANAFGTWLELIWRDGVEAAIHLYLKGKEL